MNLGCLKVRQFRCHYVVVTASLICAIVCFAVVGIEKESFVFSVNRDLLHPLAKFSYVNFGLGKDIPIHNPSPEEVAVCNSLVSTLEFGQFDREKVVFGFDNRPNEDSCLGSYSGKGQRFSRVLKRIFVRFDNGWLDAKAADRMNGGGCAAVLKLGFNRPRMFHCSGWGRVSLRLNMNERNKGSLNGFETFAIDAVRFFYGYPLTTRYCSVDCHGPEGEPFNKSYLAFGSLIFISGSALSFYIWQRINLDFSGQMHISVKATVLFISLLLMWFGLWLISVGLFPVEPFT
jgi:hypothetical protein